MSSHNSAAEENLFSPKAAMWATSRIVLDRCVWGEKAKKKICMSYQIKRNTGSETDKKIPQHQTRHITLVSRQTFGYPSRCQQFNLQPQRGCHEWRCRADEVESWWLSSNWVFTRAKLFHEEEKVSRVSARIIKKNKTEGKASNPSNKGTFLTSASVLKRGNLIVSADYSYLHERELSAGTWDQQRIAPFGIQLLHSIHIF